MSTVSSFPELTEPVVLLDPLNHVLGFSSFSSTQNPFLYPLSLLDSARACKWDDEKTVTTDVSDDVTTDDNNSLQQGASRSGIPQWWLIHTKPRQEKKLAEQLVALDIAHFLPATKYKAVTRGRTRWTIAPQFAGYMFLRGNSDQRRSALETNRIVTTHRIGDQQSISQQLWDLADLIEKGVALRIEDRLVTGQQVRVKSGLLKDKCGVVMKRGGKTRLFVFVNEFLGGVSIEIEQSLIEPY